MRIILGLGLCLLLLLLLDDMGVNPGKVALCICIFNLLDKKQRYSRGNV